MKKKLDQMENHYIVCGYGEMGQIIVEELLKHKVPVVIIEPDESALKNLGKRIYCIFREMPQMRAIWFLRGYTEPKVWYR